MGYDVLAVNKAAQKAIARARERVFCIGEDIGVESSFNGQFISSKKRKYKENLSNYGELVKEAAKNATVSVATLLNESDRVDMIYQGMQSGFGAVMYQKPGEPVEQMLPITKEICMIARYLDIDVESEIGELPIADTSTGAQSGGNKTDVDEAKRFVEETKVGALAVAVGNVHLLEDSTSDIDFGLLERLRKEIPVPVVLHGARVCPMRTCKKLSAWGIESE